MRRISVALLILLISVSLFVWMMSGASTLLPPNQSPPPSIETTQVHLGYEPIRLEVHGEVKSRLNPAIMSKIQGDVEHVLVQEGEHVAAKQALVHLKSQKIELSLQQAQHKQLQIKQHIHEVKNKQAYEKKALEQQKALLLLQQKEVNRYQYLLAHKQIAEATLEKTQQAFLKASLQTLELETQVQNHAQVLAQLYQDYHMQQTLVEKATIDHERLTIYAPYEGTVQAINVQEGDRIQSHHQVMTLFSPQALEVHAPIPADLYSPINQGSTRAHIVHDHGVTLLRLVTLEQHIASTTATHNAIFEALTPENLTMGAWTYLVIEQKNPQLSTTVPQSALYFNDTVFLVTPENKLQAIPVEVLGPSMDQVGSVVIASPNLLENQTIMTTHLPFAEPGMQVTPWDMTS